MALSKLKDNLNLTKLSYIIIIVWFIFFAWDFWTTFRVGELVNELEANPLFKIAGWFPVIALNIIVPFLMAYAYSRKNSHISTRYFIITFLVVLTVARIVVGVNNLQVAEAVATTELSNQEIIEYVEENESETNKILFMFYGVLYGMMAICMIVFYLFKMDHYIEKK